MAPDVAPENGWWKEYADVISSEYQELIAAEEDAVGIVHFHPTLIPGLLQTERYALAITGATTRKRLSTEEVRSLVDVRMQRQRSAFDPARPKRLVFLFEEACLHRPVGPPGTMREQLRHLLEVALRPDVTMVVLPLRQRPHPGLLGAFMVLRNRAGVGDVVCFEWQLGNTVRRDPDLVRDYRTLSEVLVRSAPDRRLTQRLIESALARLPGPPSTSR